MTPWAVRVLNVTELNRRALVPGLYEGGIGSDDDVAPADGGDDLSRSAYPPRVAVVPVATALIVPVATVAHSPSSDGSPGRIPFLLVIGLGHAPQVTIATTVPTLVIAMLLALAVPFLCQPEDNLAASDPGPYTENILLGKLIPSSF